MPQSPLLKCRGLYTFANKHSEVPEGALTKAENVIIDRDGVIEPRRGIKTYSQTFGSDSDRAKQLLTYKGRILMHYGTTLVYDTGTTDADGEAIFSAFSGTVSEADADGLRIKYIEANSNLYFCSSNGIKKISATSASDFTTSSPSVTQTGTIIEAGQVKALDTTAFVNYTQTGFFTQDSCVAYRVIWGIKDANNNLVLGVPSARSLIYNPISTLLIRDFNLFLSKLDAAAAASGADRLTSTDWLSTYKVLSTASASTLRSTMLTMSDDIDAELHTEVSSGGANKTVSCQVASNVATINITTTLGSTILAGDVVKVSGLTAAGCVDLNGTHVVTDSSGTYIKFAISHADFGPTADVGGTIIHKLYRPADPEELSDVPTSNELLSLQAFYDNMIDVIVTEPTSIVAAAAQTAGEFQNSTQSCVANLRFTIPSGITTGHFYQVYRTALTTSGGVATLDSLDPGDEMGLVYEGNPTSSEISAGYITYLDITPDSFRGADLYTNPNQEGIAQANEPPPLATDIAQYKGSVFFANTKTKHRKQIALLGVSNLISGTSTITIADGAVTNTYTFESGVQEVYTITTPAAASITAGQYFTMYSGNDLRGYYVWYKKDGAGTDPAVSGKTGIQVSIVTGDTASQVATKTHTELMKNNDWTVSIVAPTITVTNTDVGITTNAANGTTSGFTFNVTTAGKGEDATNKKILLQNSASLTASQQVDETARSLVRIINQQSGEIVYAQYISGPNDVPGLILLEKKTLADVQFRITANSTSTGNSFNPTLPTSGTTVHSDNEICPNRVYYSKYQQPEAVPLLNYFDVGPKDKAILRVIGLRDSLFVLKEDGIHRISGESTSNFLVTQFDNSTTLIAPDTAAVLNNQIYMLSDQGIASVSDTGVSVISRAIEDKFTVLTSSAYTDLFNASWALGYESDRAYTVHTVTDATDTVATQAFRYNTFTNTWTELPISQTCGVINPADKKMYVGAGDLNAIEVERKEFTRKDYADREYTLIILADQVSGSEVTLNSIALVEEGDVLIQTQGLTINKFNRLLEKLDNDLGVQDDDYYDELNASPGNDLMDKLDDLAAKLDADAGTDGGYAAAISGYDDTVDGILDAYNSIITRLNSDSKVLGLDYSEIDGFIEFESRISSVNTDDSSAILDYALGFVAGDVKLYKHIECDIRWSPQTLNQDPTVSKQVRIGTVIFDNDAYSTAEVLYASDLSPSFESIDTEGSGSGVWSYGGSFGSGYWGGGGSGAPFITLIPLEKQRCRYIQCEVIHSNAFERFAIIGNSYTYEVMGPRAYK